MEGNDTKLPMRQRETGEWEGDGLSGVGEKEESGADAESIWLLGTECRIKNQMSAGRKEAGENKIENVGIETREAARFERGTLTGGGFAKMETTGNRVGKG